MPSPLLVTAAVVFLFWLLLSSDRLRRWPGELLLERRRPQPTDPAVAVLVPARDEARILPDTLPSLLGQDYPRWEVVLVDDQSTDATAETALRIAARVGAADRLTVVEAGERPAGWAGKVWAQHRGLSVLLETRAEPPPWLLLTDADIHHHPASLASLVAKAGRGGYDLVSVMARLHATGFWERLIVPPFVYFFHLLYPFRAVRQRGSRVAAAAGGCVLVRTADLVEAGGFAATAAARIDDVALARLLKRHGSRLWLGLDPDIRSLRRYDRLSELWRMIARSAFDQLGYRWSLVAAVLVGLGLFFVSPPLLLVLGAVRTRTAGLEAQGLACALLAAGAWGLEAWGLLPWARHHGVPRPLLAALSLPVAAALYGAMTLGSALSHVRGGGVAWKGRRERS